MKRPKRIRKHTLRQRLQQQRPEILEKKKEKSLWEEEVRRKNWAANAQALYDTYASELLNPMARAMPMGGIEHHKRRLERLLKEAEVFRDPMRGLPQY